MEVEADAFAVLRHLVEEVELELAVVGCSVVVPDTSAIEAGAQGKDRTFPA